MEEYAVYLRKSRADMALEQVTREDTLGRHKSLLVELAQQKQLHIAAYYEEIVSGESIAARPEMQRLLQDIYQQKYCGVLVVEVERLARGDTKDQGIVADAFKYTGTRIITPTKTYDPDNEFDEEYFEFGLFMSRREYKTISRRMEQGKIAAVKEGNYIAAQRPYGYQIIKPAKKLRTLEEYPPEADYVRLIYHWFTEEKISAGEIARRLTAMGVPTYTGQGEWSHSTITEILHNPVYTGVVRWKYRPISKTVNQQGDICHQRNRSKNKEGMVLAPGKHPALISNQLFAAAQHRFDEQPSRVPLKKTMINPFAGLIYCKSCHRALFYHQTEKSPGTRPRIAHRASASCKVKSCFYDDLMITVIEALQQHIMDFPCTCPAAADSSQQQQAAIAAMEHQLSLINRRITQLFDYLERQLYSEEEFRQRKQLLTKQQENIQRQLHQLESSPLPVLEASPSWLFSQALEQLKHPLVAPQDKNKLLKTIIKRIEYSRIDEQSFLLDIYLH